MVYNRGTDNVTKMQEEVAWGKQQYLSLKMMGGQKTVIREDESCSDCNSQSLSILSEDASHLGKEGLAYMNDTSAIAETMQNFEKQGRAEPKDKPKHRHKVKNSLF